MWDGLRKQLVLGCNIRMIGDIGRCMSNATKPCTYCGELGNHRDHVVPKSIHQNSVTVPACAECNILLSNQLYVTIPDRKAYLKEVYKKRYKDLINMPNWTEKELEDVGDRMRQEILSALHRKTLILARIKTCGERSKTFL